MLWASLLVPGSEKVHAKITQINHRKKVLRSILVWISSKLLMLLSATSGSHTHTLINTFMNML